MFKEKIKNIPPEMLVYVDESGVNTHLYRDKGYGKRCCKIYDKISGKRFARENFIAAKVGKQIIAPTCYTGSCDTELFNLWIEQFLMPQLQPGQIVIMDNAAFHKSEKTQNLIKSAKCEILFLPPYSPELNPIEKFWANLKRRIRKTLKNCCSLQEAIDNAFVYYAP